MDGWKESAVPKKPLVVLQLTLDDEQAAFKEKHGATANYSLCIIPCSGRGEMPLCVHEIHRCRLSFRLHQDLVHHTCLKPPPSRRCSGPEMYPQTDLIPALLSLLSI